MNYNYCCNGRLYFLVRYIIRMKKFCDIFEIVTILKGSRFNKGHFKKTFFISLISPQLTSELQIVKYQCTSFTNNHFISDR